MLQRRRYLQAAVLAASICQSACTPQESERALDGGWQVYGFASHINCGTVPVLLNGNRMDLTMDGACSRMRLAGNHNDVDIAMSPGGIIEITGSHNDVTWHLPSGVQTKPVLIDHGESNTFHSPG